MLVLDDKRWTRPFSLCWMTEVISLVGKVGPELFCIFDAGTWLVQQGHVLCLNQPGKSTGLIFHVTALQYSKDPGPACFCSSCKSNINNESI